MKRAQRAPGAVRKVCEHAGCDGATVEGERVEGEGEGVGLCRRRRDAQVEAAEGEALDMAEGHGEVGVPVERGGGSAGAAAAVSGGVGAEAVAIDGEVLQDAPWTDGSERVLCVHCEVAAEGEQLEVGQL